MIQEFIVFIFIIYLCPKGPMDHAVHQQIKISLFSPSILKVFMLCQDAAELINICYAQSRQLAK